MSIRSRLYAGFVTALAAGTGLAQTPADAPQAAAVVGLAKLIIGDVPANQRFYEQMFGMTEVAHYSAAGVYDEPIMGFESGGARLALFSPLAEAPLPKSQFPVVLIYTPDFDAVTKRIAAAKHPIVHLPTAQSGPYRIAIARDPSGNAVEILARSDRPAAVGGAKLIVADRQKAEEFYARVFGVKPIQRYKAPTYDEVLMGFGSEAWLALFEPKNEAPLAKSQFPVVAIYTSEFDAVLEKIETEGLGHREIKTSRPGLRIVIAKDPSGNGVEIISR